MTKRKKPTKKTHAFKMYELIGEQNEVKLRQAIR